jgi:hypothetical protein
MAKNLQKQKKKKHKGNKKAKRIRPLEKHENKHIISPSPKVPDHRIADHNQPPFHFGFPASNRQLKEN